MNSSSVNPSVSLKFLKSVCSSDIWPMVAQVMENPDFQRWSGAGEKDKHHYGTGGLFQHTYEVVLHSLNIAKTHEQLTGKSLLIDEIVVAAVWHDFGKIWDYQEKDGVWGKFNNHAREIHHICRSAIEFEKFVSSCAQLPKNFNTEHVLHIILAHHGRREWGSPIAPHTREALIVHMADSISARLNDCETHQPF